MTARSGVNLALEREGKVVVERTQPFEVALLSLPGCKLETISPPGATRPATMFSVTAYGDLLYDNGRLLKRAGKDLETVEPPANADKETWGPVLSDDGAALVWKTRGPVQLMVRDLANGSERTIPLDLVPSGYEPIAADVASDEFVLGKYPLHVLIVDSRGAVQWAPKTAIGVGGMADALSFRRIGDGWAAWHMSSPAKLEWSTTKGSGNLDFPMSSIQSLSVDPAGERIAISLSASTSMDIDEAVLLLRISDGKELFRRLLPKYSRVRLAFLDDNHLAMNSDGGVDVVRIPESLAPLDPAPPPGPTTLGKPTDFQAQNVAYAEAMAKQFGLELEKPSASAATDLVGQWKLVDLGDRVACGFDEAFLEFRSDGFAYGPGTQEKMGALTVGDRYIVVKSEDPEFGPNLIIFVMSGSFYLPSFECGLVRLGKVP